MEKTTAKLHPDNWQQVKKVSNPRRKQQKNQKFQEHHKSFKFYCHTLILVNLTFF